MAGKKKKAAVSLGKRIGMYFASGGLLVLLTAAIGFLVLYTPEKSQMKSTVVNTMPDNRTIDLMSYELPTSEPPTEPPTGPPIEYEMHIDLDKVMSYHATNPDVYGWVYIDQTAVNYPVMKTNNNDTYMHTDWQGNSSFAGSIFADFECNLPKSTNTLLYGHNMANGSMFAGIKKFQNQEWTETHPYFEVSTLTRRYLYKAVSVNVLYGENGADFRYWDYKNLDENGYAEFTRLLKETSRIWYGWYADKDNPPPYGTRLVSLQTCNSGSHDGMRFLVFGECLGEY